MYQQKNIFANNFNFFLTLSDHMVLQSESKETDIFFDLLEANDIIPKTVTWYGSIGLMNRLYYSPNTNKLSRPLDISLGKLRLVMANGSNKDRVMSSLQPAASMLQWVAGRSLIDMNPVQLPAFVLSWLFDLAFITSLDQLKKAVAKLMSSFEPRLS
jgi:hypothetical protein